MVNIIWCAFDMNENIVARKIYSTKILQTKLMRITVAITS